MVDAVMIFELFAWIGVIAVVGRKWFRQGFAAVQQQVDEALSDKHKR